MTEPTPVIVPIAGQDYQAVWPDSLPWFKQSPYMRASIQRDLLLNKLYQRVWTEAEAADYDEHLDVMFVTLFPSVPKKVLRTLWPGDKQKAVVSFLELSDNTSMKMAMSACLSTLRAMSPAAVRSLLTELGVIASSPESAPSSTSTPDTSSPSPSSE